MSWSHYYRSFICHRHLSYSWKLLHTTNLRTHNKTRSESTAEIKSLCSVLHPHRPHHPHQRKTLCPGSIPSRTSPPHFLLFSEINTLGAWVAAASSSPITRTPSLSPTDESQSRTGHRHCIVSFLFFLFCDLNLYSNYCLTRICMYTYLNMYIGIYLSIYTIYAVRLIYKVFEVRLIYKLT
jgi:hypothetical protein